MYKLHNKLLPEIFDQFFKENTSIHEHQTRQSHQLHFPIYRTSVVNLFITKIGVILWNEVIGRGNGHMKLGELKLLTKIEHMCKY